MENFEDLESDLFGRDFKNSKSPTINESKKKVMFKDFDENDPHRDLNFSDDDDFQESLEEKPTVIVKDDQIANLFGISTEKKVEEKSSLLPKASVIDDTITKKSPILPIKSSLSKPELQDTILKESDFPSPLVNAPIVPKLENPPQKNLSAMKSIFDDDNDFASNLPEKSKTPTNSQAKKSLLMEDLFGSRTKPSSSADTNKRKSTVNFEVPISHSSPGESLTGLTNEGITKTSNTTGFSLSASREPRRGRRTSTVQNDPLGLLSASSLQIEEPKIEEKEVPSVIAETKSTVTEDLPEWLGGPKVSKEQKQETEKISRSETISSVKSGDTLAKTSTLTDPPITIPGMDNLEQSGLTSKLLGIEFDQQATILNMQQQEHELRTATVLSQQNEKLNYLLEMQKTKLIEQEKQFNMLITRQLDRQTLLEKQMKSQQERIDNYIQTLTAQPTGMPSINLSINKDISMDSTKGLIDEKTELESLLQKLQLEKLYLENTLDSLKEKHEKEITILENSYRKQVAFLEEAMVQMEKRMQDDVECLETDYKLKIQKLKEEILENERIHKTEKETLKEEHFKSIQDIQERHFRSLEIMQKEHTEIIERITKSKESERHAIEIMRSDGINVQNILNKSQVLVEGLDNLQKKFDSRDNNFIESQANHLITQEKNIEYLKESLEKQKEALIEEKQHLITIVRKFELNTSELINEFQKQNASFKENEEILKSREQALLRDREIFVEQTNWERERLQAMREMWAKEEDKQMEWLSQERQAIAIEKGKFEIFNRLKIGVDESSKIELETTIKTAHDAVMSANQEKMRWQEKINELEMQQRTLQEKENRLFQKAKELQEFTQSAIAKKEEGLRALKEAHFLKERYKEKLNQLQMQQEMLTQRESKLAAEKLELARERLQFRVNEAEKPEKDIVDNMDIMISHAEDRSRFSEVPSSTKYTTYFKDVVDPNLLLLKWDLDSKLDIPNEHSITTIH